MIDFLTDEGVGTPTPEHRKDTVAEGRIAITRPVTRFLSVEVAWRGSRRLSNVDVYEYHRQIIGTYLRVQSF